MEMVVLIGVMGRSGTGKTTLIEKIVVHIVSKGLSVGAIKHSSHENFDLSGKDTTRIREAGADIVVGISRKEMITITDARSDFTSPEQLKDLFKVDVDVIIIEGYRSLIARDESVSKIILAKDTKHLHPWLPGLKGRRVAVLEDADSRSSYRGIPIVPMDDLRELFARIEKELVRT